jgi:hypothetical protein
MEAAIQIKKRGGDGRLAEGGQVPSPPPDAARLGVAPRGSLNVATLDPEKSSGKKSPSQLLAIEFCGAFGSAPGFLCGRCHQRSRVMTELIVTRAGLETHMARAELATEAAPPREQMRALLNAAWEGLPDAPERPGEVAQFSTNKPD